MTISPSFALRAFGCHLLRRYRRAVVTPRAALVIDDVRNVGIAECVPEWWHRAGIDDAAYIGALQSMQHDADVCCRIGVVDRYVAFQSRECSRKALPGCLVAGGAVGSEQRQPLGRVVTVASRWRRRSGQCDGSRSAIVGG